MKQISSILLALVLLIGSTGFTLSKHHCGGKTHKQSVNFIADDLVCGMETIEKAPCEDNTIGSDCCENEFQNFKITDSFRKLGEDINFNFTIAFINSYVTLFTTFVNKTTQHLAYKPPLPDKDIPVLIQSFLI